jgi:uncharacterized repeat protein (TIGR03943 family)
MNLRAYRTFQALILAALGIFFLSKIMNGRILLYINQRFVILIVLAALGFIFIAQLLLRERPAPAALDAVEDYASDGSEAEDDSQRKGWVLWLVVLPLLMGLLVPERPLGASALTNRGVNTTTGLSVQGGAAQAIEIPSTQRSVMDWIRILIEVHDPAEYDNQAADVTGFVYHDARLAADQFLVTRFSIACCVADATALGMAVRWPDAPALGSNQWVRVRGKVHLQDLDGRPLLLIQAEQVDLIPEPEQPYLFP